MKKFAAFLLRIMGWRITQGMPEGIPKAVIIMAPHTSNIDFIFGKLGFISHGVRPKTIIKKESFFFPLGIILSALGAIPIDRGFSAGTIKKLTKLMEESDSFFLVIAPEGTRKLAKNWKKGFYFLAEQARVPIIMGFLDYKTKTGGLGPVLYPSGNYEDDLRKIQDFYKEKQARHPEMFNLSPENLQG